MVPNIRALNIELDKSQPDINVLQDVRVSLVDGVNYCNKYRNDLVTIASEFSNITRALSFSSAVDKLDTTIKKSNEILERVTKYIKDNENK